MYKLYRFKNQKIRFIFEYYTERGKSLVKLLGDASRLTMVGDEIVCRTLVLLLISCILGI